LSLRPDTGTGEPTDSFQVDISSKIALVGTSYRTAPLDFREDFAKRLARIEAVATASGLREFSVLQTCNRVELYYSLTGNGESTEFMIRQLGYDDLEGLYVKHDLEAIEHLFNVATGLDSVAVGEGQILRQVRSASLQARASGNSKSVLSPLFDSAYTSSIRIRRRFHTSTEAGSLSELALRFAIERLGKKPSNVLVVGTGETAKLTALQLGGAKIHILTNRSLPRPLPPNSVRVSTKSLSAAIAKCELIISATRRAGYVLSKADIPDIGRRVVVDLGFPRNVDPEIRSLKSVELLDLDDIASLASQSNEGAKWAPARKAVEAEAIRFYGWLTATRLNPALASIYRWAEHVREDEAALALRRLPLLSEKERRIVEIMSRRLVSRLMAPHAEFAKGDVSPSDQKERLRLLEKIFAVEGPV
jgi:glutamyl-tRNA reductase